MKLSELIARVQQYRGITDDSRRIRPGFVFVTGQRTHSDGHRYVPAAIANGASVVVSDCPDKVRNVPPSVEVVAVSDHRKVLALLADRFHGQPTRSVRLYGVTGTCSKTTTTYILEALLAADRRNVGVIGTQNIRFAGATRASTHTTPNSPELLEAIADMRAAGVTDVVMEVSSHALKQRRVYPLLCDHVVFMNLTVEHLDLHATMDDYVATKATLSMEYAERACTAGKAPVACINIGDKYGRKLERSVRVGRFCTVIPFGRGAATFNDERLRYTLDGITGNVGEIAVRSPLVGRFNGANLLAAAAVARSAGVSDGTIAEGIPAAKSAPGRLERVGEAEGIAVFVDYAHKPGALEPVLRTLRATRRRGALICVFGCGGDRDRAKRPEMAAVAEGLADRVYVTSDNPRLESPDQIIADIIRGFRFPRRVVRMSDRSAAIDRAVRQARPGDVVLIAGRRPEEYQIIADPDRVGETRQVPLDDRMVARQAIARRTLQPGVRPLTAEAEKSETLEETL
jgi:UDP-N-acetylmuramoyl-L-alanyl-D-glutamate--2,6-diaminopimelate ligase